MTVKLMKIYVPAWSVILFALVALSNAALKREAGSLRGTIVDPQGAAVPNTEIALRWNDTGEPMSWNGVHARRQKPPRNKWLHLVTDSAGRFSAQLDAGNWDVFGYRDHFAPTCTIILIEPGKTTNVDLHFSGLAAMSVQ